MQCLNLCIYPLDDCSVVMLFVDKSYTKYKPFSKQFNEKDFDTKLSIINYIVLSLTEDYYIYPNMDGLSKLIHLFFLILCEN